MPVTRATQLPAHAAVAAVPQAALEAESREAFRLRRLALVAGSVW